MRQEAPKVSINSNDIERIPGATESARTKCPRILVVDDQPQMLKSIKRHLKSQFDVVTCETGKRAVELLRNDSGFDAVLCDLNLEDLSGHQVYKESVKIAPELARKFIFITGGVFREEVEDFLKKTGLPLVEKPFQAGSLIDTLNKITGM